MTRADAIVINARIVTMDPLVPLVSALAIVAGRIAALGSDADISTLAGSRTQVIDAGGRMVLPGFQDTHIHLQDSGQDYSQNADLSAARTVDELVDTLASFAGAHRRAWVNGTGWYSGVFGAQNLNAEVLDRAVPDRPCMIVASDGHNACLNTLGLKAVGFDRNTPDPLNGTIVRDASGEATGLLYESAIYLAEGRMPAPSDRDFADGVLYIHGRMDLVCPIEAGMRLHQAMPHAEYIILPNAGHIAQGDEMINALVSATDNFAYQHAY